ncbi:Endochitinase [Nymphon striatum]|nr:Endochitinase [Nymphon striatum]
MGVFATSHGKSPCDGIGGTVKRLTAQASLKRTVTGHILDIVDNEINPVVDKWESDEYGGLGLDYTFQIAVLEELGHINCAGVTTAIGVQTDMSTPALSRLGGNSFDDFFGKQTKTVTTTKITKSETTSHTGQSLGTHNYVDKGGYDIKTTYTKKGEAIIDFSYCLKPIGYFQHPLYCDLYLNCYDENAYVLKCPQNMFFDSVSNQCNLKDNVNCGSRQISTATTHEVKPSSSHVDKTVITSSSHQSTIKTTILDSGEAYIDFSYCLQPTGQFPHPEYCSLFLNCYNNRAYIQECPSDLFFNDAIKGCDYPNNVDCGSRWTTGASSVFTTSGSKVTTDHAGSSSSGSSITSGSHSGSETLITSESHQSIIKTFVTDSGEHYIDFSYCPQPTGQFPHPEYCSLFLNCYNNRAYIQECPSGLFFKDAIKGCDYPKNVDCGSRWKTGASSVFTTRKSKLATFDGGSYSSHTTITTTITKTGNIAGFYTWINPEC